MNKETNIISAEALAVLKQNESTAAPSQAAIKFSSSLIAVALAFLVGFILITLLSFGTSLDNYGNEIPNDFTVLTFLNEMYRQNFSSVEFFTEMLSRMSYLLPLGLALVVSFRMGIFNIGAAGQAYLGGVIACFVAGAMPEIPFGFIITIAVGVGCGMFVAWIVAVLKNKFNINEVITSIMLNWVILYVIMQYRTELITVLGDTTNDLRLDSVDNLFGIFGGQVATGMNLGVILMIPLAIVFALLYKFSKWGYKQDLIGENANTGKYLGVNSKKEITKTMLISGGLAGFAGVVFLAGVNTSSPELAKEAVELPATTFDGIAIALVGYNSPLGIIASTFMFSILKAPELDGAIGDYRVVEIITGLMVIFIAATALKVKYGGKK